MVLLLVLALLVQAGTAHAAPTHAKAAGATPFRLAAFDSLRHFDVNRLDMAMSNFGTLAYDLSTFDSGLEFPRGSGKTVVFDAGLWVGAKVGGQARVTVAEYSSEWRPGRVFGVVPEPPLAAYLRNWKMRPAGAWRAPADSARFDAPGARDPLRHESWLDYVLAHPMTDAPMRTVRLPVPGSPGDSAWTLGPDLPGDQALWSTFTDADPAAHTNNAGGSPPLGLEVRQTVFGFATTPGNVAFVRWKLFHHGEAPLDSAYVTFWVDPDLGFGGDDLVGWDPALQMGYAYNATNTDYVYGAQPPAVGVRFLSGPAGATAGAFNKYIGGTDPDTATVTYALMRGLHLDGSEWIDPTTSLPTRFPLSGDPVAGTGFLDTNAADRRFLVSAGPFDLAIGDSAEFVFAVVVGGGLDRLDSIERLRCEAQLAGTSALLGFAPQFPSNLRIVEASTPPNVVFIRWTAEGSVPRSLEVRRHAGPVVAPWPLDAETRNFIYPDGSGRLTFVDDPLPPGEQATYGLFEPCDPLEPLSQVTLAGPGGAFAFRVLSPSSGQQLELSLQLPADAPVRLEAFSVDGRRRLDSDLGSRTHGPQVVSVPLDRIWPSGLYFLRLTQGTNARLGRVVIVR